MNLRIEEIDGETKKELTYDDILAKMGMREQNGQLYKVPIIPSPKPTPTPSEELYRLRNAAILAMIRRKRAKPKKMFFK
jgi:hypothetical protein